MDSSFSSRMSLGESSRNMFHNIRLMTATEPGAPAPDPYLKDMGSMFSATTIVQEDPAPRKSRRRYLGMKPPSNSEGDGLFRV